MPTSYQADRRIRAPAAVAALAMQAAIVAALVSGLAEKVADSVARQRFEVLSIPAPPRPSPTPPPVEPQAISEAGAPKEEEGAAGRRAEATQIVAPKPPIAFPSPPPVVTAPTAGTGNQPSAGAADSGTGPGAGNAGQGAGGGGLGGSGGGTGLGGGRGARRVAGALRDSDYPEEAAYSGAAGTVFIRFSIGIDGRVRGCRVTRSSGSALLDDLTCRLVERRFRYRPALDSGGRPVESVEGTSFTWGTRQRY